MPKRDPATLRSRDATPRPDKVEEPLTVTHPEHAEDAPAEGETTPEPPPAATAKKKRTTRKKADPTETTASPPEQQQEPSPALADAGEQLQADLDQLGDYLNQQEIQVISIASRDGMPRFLLPDARGGHFGLFVCLNADRGDPRYQWQGPRPDWMRQLYARGYMVEPVFGFGQARDLIERYRQFEATPTPFRAR